MSDEVPDLTLQEAAEHLGVHYMTAYRYVRLGVLPAYKNGSTWRVRRSDLDRVSGSSTARSTAAVAPKGRRTAPWSARLESRLVAGDTRGAWTVFEAAMAAGMDLAGLYLEVLCPAMASIGERWAAGELDVAVEHQASAIATRLAGRVGGRFLRPGRTRGIVVIGTAAREHHVLPVTLLADLARSAGFDVVDVGADIPPESMALLVARCPPLLAVALSAMTPDNEDSVRATVGAVRQVRPDVPIIVGGRAVATAEEAHRIGADHWASDGTGFLAVLDALARP